MRRFEIASLVLLLACGDAAAIDGEGEGTPSPMNDGGPTTSGSDGGVDPSADASAGADADADADAGADADADAAPACVDADGDGYGVGPGCLGLDCNDQDPLVNPAMLELADDGIDNDCKDGDVTAATSSGATNAVFVDVGNLACSDKDAMRGTKAVPYCTLGTAVVEAYQATMAADRVGKWIFVAKGSYPHVIGTPRSMRITGGYDGTTWIYDAQANPTIIGGENHLDDTEGAACRYGAGCSAQCPCIDWDGWISINADASVALRGFTIEGGVRLNGPLKTISINSSARVVLADNAITGGGGIQNVAVQIPATAIDVWLLRNTISAGVPFDNGPSATVFGVNSLGNASLWGNRIDMGPGKAQSWGAAVQNFGTMRLSANVLNGGDFGGDADYSYGLLNFQTGMPVSAGTAYVVNDVIYAGRGKKGSAAVFSNSPLTLVNDVLGDRVPVGLTWAQRPTEKAVCLDVGFSSSTTARANDFVQLVYDDEPSPPNALANRALVAHSKQTTSYLTTIGEVNVCTWSGCVASTGNLSVAPGFVGAADFHLGAASALSGQGIEAANLAAGLGTIDIDRTFRPTTGAWAIGIDEK